MKQIFIISFISFLFNTNLLAVTLPEALLEAYKNNPVLNAERENINISQENLNISKSEFLPTITITGTKSREDTTKLPDGIPPTVYNYLKNNDVELEEVLTNLAFEKIEI